MLKLFGEKQDSERDAREAIQQRKWAKAIAYYEKKAQRGERNFSLWNLLGDLHMNNKSRQKAVEAWRVALDGYAAEGLHENVLGIARKILRRIPEEEEVYLVLARACLELEYHADCLAALRSYIHVARRRSEPELKSLFVKVMESTIHHPHLLEELRSLFAESKLEDVELGARLEQVIETRLLQEAQKSEEPAPEASASGTSEMWRVPSVAPPTAEGLIMLDHRHEDSLPPPAGKPAPSQRPSLREDAPEDFAAEFDEGEIEDSAPTSSSDGKDHYDLGNVYREMQLWDAAAAEFEQARNDPSLRMRASLALAECLQQMSNLHGALEILESESRRRGGSPEERLNLNFQLGAIYEQLGNFREALAHFETVFRQNSRHAAAEERIQVLRKRIGVESN